MDYCTLCHGAEDHPSGSLLSDDLVGILGIIGRLVASWMSDFFGRRWSDFLIGMGGAVAMALAGYWHDVYIGGLSVFFVLVMIQRFFGDASYAIIGPYIAEVWPNRLRARAWGSAMASVISARSSDRSGWR